MDELITMTAAELSAAMGAGKVSAAEVTTAHLNRIAAVDSQVRAFLHMAGDEALAQAREVDRKRAAGEPLGPLAGIPVAVKDLFTTVDMPTTCGSRILEGWRPPYESTITTRLRDAGAVLIGKTNMDEFAMGSSTENSGYGSRTTRGTWPECPAGHREAAPPRWPPTRPRSRSAPTPAARSASPPRVVRDRGHQANVWRLLSLRGRSVRLFPGHAGPFGRNVLDTALLHEAMSGHDPMDSTSIDAPVPPVVEAARHGDVTACGSGWSASSRRRLPARRDGQVHRGSGTARVARRESHRDQLPALQVRAARLLPDRAERGVVQPGPLRRHALRAAGRHRQRGRGRWRRPGRPGSARRSSAASCSARTRLSSGYYDAYYGKAQKVRTLIIADFDAAFGQVDVLVSPVTPTTAFPIGERVDDPMAMYLDDLCTIPADLAGNAAISVPCGLADEDGLPVGLQVMAPALADDRLYRVAAAVEAAFADRVGASVAQRGEGAERVTSRPSPTKTRSSVTSRCSGSRRTSSSAPRSKMFCGCSTDVRRRAEHATPARSASACPARCRW